MCILRLSVPTTKAINEYIIKTTGFTSFFCVENMTMSMTCSDGVHPEATVFTEMSPFVTDCMQLAEYCIINIKYLLYVQP
jgi:hypothetical protein